MAGWAEVVQSLLWVGLVGGIFWRYHHQIHSLLAALAERIEAGSSVKVAGFELGVKPQPAEQQRARLEEEIQELEASAKGTETPERSSLVSTYIQAEDLALRAVQADYQRPVQRQVSLGGGVNVDAVFFNHGVLNVVEVKYSYHKLDSHVVKSGLEQLSGYRWRNQALVGARYILVLVGEQEDLGVPDEALYKVVEEYDLDVEVKYYNLNELKQRFGGGWGG